MGELLAVRIMLSFAGVALAAFALLFVGGVVVCVILDLRHAARRRARGADAAGPPRPCPSEACDCVNPPAARFCRRCGVGLSPDARPDGVAAVRR